VGKLGEGNLYPELRTRRALLGVTIKWAAKKQKSKTTCKKKGYTFHNKGSAESGLSADEAGVPYTVRRSNTSLPTQK